MVPLLVYALLGGSRAMSVSTTSTIATLTATTMVSVGVATTSDAAAGTLATLTLMVGAILLLARLFRLGAIVENINEATLVGLKVGLGLTVALGQVPKLLGVDIAPTGTGFVRTVIATIEAVPQTNGVTLALSLGTLAVLLLLSRLAPRVPAQLVVTVCGIALAAIVGLGSFGVDLVGTVPSGLPAIVLPSFENLAALVPGALAIALMAFLETASVARGIRQKGDPQVDNDRELFAIGAVNLLSAFSGTLPAAGGFSQSAVNQRAGAKSQLATLVTAALAVAVALFLAPVIASLPEAVLAAVVLIAVTGLIDFGAMARFYRLSRREFWISLVTALIGLAAGLLPAVLAGVIFTLGGVLREVSRPHLKSSVNGTTLTVRLGIGLFTASVRPTCRAIEQLLDDSPEVRRVVLDVSVISITTLTVLDALAEFDTELANRSVTLQVVGLAGQPLELANNTPWWRDKNPAEKRPPASGGDG
jgi:MFS superfamily sulfate permease-like transporter